MISNKIKAVGRSYYLGIWSLTVVAIGTSGPRARRHRICIGGGVRAITLVLKNSVYSLNEVGGLRYRWAASSASSCSISGCLTASGMSWCSLAVWNGLQLSTFVYHILSRILIELVFHLLLLTQIIIQ